MYWGIESTRRKPCILQNFIVTDVNIMIRAGTRASVVADCLRHDSVTVVKLCDVSNSSVFTSVVCYSKKTK